MQELTDGQAPALPAVRKKETPVAGQIFVLIPRVMADIGSVSKDRRNEQQKYAFRGIEDFYEAAQPALIKHGVFCVPRVEEHLWSEHEKPGYEGKTTIWRHVTLRVNHQFYAPDGSHVDVVTYGEGLDNSDKATNKAMSGAMKYALIELFSVPTKDIEDADRTSPEAGRTTEVKKYSSAAGNSAQGAATGKAKPVPQAADTISTAGDKPQPAEAKERRPLKSDGPAAPISATQPAVDEAAVPVDTIQPVKELPGCITMGQAINFERAFQAALRPFLHKNASKFSHDWLQSQGILADGKPTAYAIRAESFFDVRTAAIEYAKSL